MVTQTKPSVKIEEIPIVYSPDSKITIPYRDREVVFAHPSFGPDTYTNVGNQIEEAGLLRPTSEETIHLVHAAYFDNNKDSPQLKNVRDIMKNRWFWEFTRNLWTPEGVFVYDNRDGKEKDEKYLAQRLESNDSSVKFVPNGFKRGEQISRELEKNPYILARYDEEGAEKLAELSEKFKKNPFIYGLTEVSRPTQRVSALSENLDGHWLGVDGSYLDGDRDGGALGVFDSNKEGS